MILRNSIYDSIIANMLPNSKKKELKEKLISCAGYHIKWPFNQILWPVKYLDIFRQRLYLYNDGSRTGVDKENVSKRNRRWRWVFTWLCFV